ncbi:uncharacterized protein Z518_04900 [Rhinocladiella mackenziei CBS 650.93]|uniref:Uncharacterized protein n=1 Tax=Rhinocladiella mackenziei CBS 650.93 TaxID=1442369 RepID=A0A0D2IME8_9EURO|nr:uncharacterized protein Z518_04900 [Rhinocladiella mackenziei CBS 650.93]KIX06924.1 hypothetical protein Z518_04900 [Rhinocladiella mackenziei CBS 650.93]
MGRQSHLTRLALGRSPFEAPEQDDNGDFLLGPNIQHDTSRDYVQHFDARGHPQNLTSLASSRRFMRAQNDALSTVGVVVRKEKMNRSFWQTMSDEQKHQLLLDENILGAHFGLLVTFLQKLSTRWIVTFRRRLLTYKSYLGLPIPSMILSEWRILGPRAFLFAGIPLATISSLSEFLRDEVLDDDRLPDVFQSSSILSERGMVVRTIGNQSLRILWFAVQYPFYAFSVLQSLYLLPLQTTPNLLSLIPFTRASLIQAPELSLGRSMPSLFSSAMNIVSHPFLLAYIKDRVGKFLFTKFYAIARHFVVKPDRPDRISLLSARQNISFQDTTISRMALSSQISRDYYGAQAVVEAIRTWFPATFWLWEKLLQTLRAPLPVELSPDIEEELLQRSRMYRRQMLQRDRETVSDLTPRQLRVRAIRSAFNDYNLDPDHAIVDIFAMADEMSSHTASDVSTSTPDPTDLPPAAQTMQEPRSENNIRDELVVEPGTSTAQALPDQIEDNSRAENAQSADAQSGISTSLVVSTSPDPEDITMQSAVPQPTVPLETLLEAASTDTDDDPWPRPSTPIPALSSPSPSQYSPDPSSPVPGISRAASLPLTNPRPIRRPTDIDHGLRPVREELLYRQQPPRNLRHGEEGQYRVTILSNHPAEMFALSLASVVETVVLLPFEILFLRSLAQNHLTHQSRVGMTGADALLADVWPIGSWVKNFSFAGWCRFMGNWSITIGMQGLINFVIWKASTHLTLRLGRQFGWGNI